MAATKDGRGYWLVARDGSIYAFGDAQFYGVPPVLANSVFVGMAAIPMDAVTGWLPTTAAYLPLATPKYYGSATGPQVQRTVEH